MGYVKTRKEGRAGRAWKRRKGERRGTGNAEEKNVEKQGKEGEKEGKSWYHINYREIKKGRKEEAKS